MSREKMDAYNDTVEVLKAIASCDGSINLVGKNHRDEVLSFVDDLNKKLYEIRKEVGGVS